MSAPPKLPVRALVPPRRLLARLSRAFADPDVSLSPPPSPYPPRQENTNVRVVCRFRCAVGPEIGHPTVSEYVGDDTVAIHGKEYLNSFTFDRVFNHETSQLDMYHYVVQDTLNGFFEGYNGTILAYGQTGSGKSYTMFGSASQPGLIPRITNDLFGRIGTGPADVEYTVSVSYMEIYNEHIRDLLNPQQTDFSIHEDKNDGVYVRGLSYAFVSSAPEISEALRQGSASRATAATSMNVESLRSHAIFHIKLSQKNQTLGAVKKSSLFLVDLAGSEKIDKTGVVLGLGLQETKKINSSLSVLGLVINLLTDGKSTHVPYRDSKLTRILQESLGGNSRTTLVVNCLPAAANEAETLSTLRFGLRAKKIRNTVHVNTEVSVRQLQRKIAQLEATNDRHEAYIRALEAEMALLTGGPVSSSVPGNLLPKYASPRTPTKIPLPTDRPSPLLDEIDRRDRKIAELEAAVLKMKMASVQAAHDDELKLFRLENALHTLNDKLSDVELINVNLRKHLLISEKIIDARDAKIDKLGTLLVQQQAQISRESASFELRLDTLRDSLKSSDDHTIRDFLTSPEVAEQVGSPRSPKTGLNLRIVKPVRGGAAPEPASNGNENGTGTENGTENGV